MIPNILCDAPFGQNQSLKSADGCYIGILKSKMKDLQKS